MDTGPADITGGMELTESDLWDSEWSKKTGYEKIETIRKVLLEYIEKNREGKDESMMPWRPRD